MPPWRQVVSWPPGSFVAGGSTVSEGVCLFCLVYAYTGVAFFVVFVFKHLGRYANTMSSLTK